MQSPSAHLTAVFRHLALRFLHVSPVAENNSLNRVDSRVCKDCFPNLHRTAIAIDNQSLPLHHFALPVYTLPKLDAW